MNLKLVLILLAVVTVLGCENNYTHHGTAADKQSSLQDSSDFTMIQWIDSARDLGKINEGDKIEVAFRFKNTGDKPLVIASVTPSCGCTAADPPKEPIAPGKEGVIKGVFDSNGKPGPSTKSLTVQANTKPSQYHTLAFSVEVKAKQK